MLTGAHIILYSRDAAADRAFLRDVLRLPSVDGGGGWLIFALPASEVAVHPVDGDPKHELYLLCRDISDFIATMKRRGIECGPVSHERWGILTQLQLPGGGRLGVYEPHHPRPTTRTGRKVPTPAARRRTARAHGSARATRRSRAR
jgi:hypothetical protein